MKLRGRIQPSDALAHAISALETLQTVSSVVGTIPLLGTITGTALALLTTLERVKGDRERCSRLARRVCDLLQHVERALGTGTDIMDGDLSTSLMNLQSNMIAMCFDLEDMKKKGACVRFLSRASVAARLDQHLETLDALLHSFNLTCLIALRRKATEQAMYGKYQLRLLRWCDVRLQRRHGDWCAHSDICGDELQGEWEGRAVTIRVFRSGNDIEDALKTYFDGLPQCPHPSISQLLGYSHPSISPRFYIFERGSLPVLHHFKASDPLTVLSNYLKMHIDYQELIVYLQSARFPGTKIGAVHCHGDCLPSLSVKTDGTLVVCAEDLVDATVDCLAHRLRVLCGNTREQLTRMVFNSPESNDGRMLLSMIQHNLDNDTNVHAQRAERLRSLEGLKVHISSYAWSSSSQDAHIGDYGYEDHQTGLFMRLGNIYELLERATSAEWALMMYVNDALELHSTNYTWSEHTWSSPCQSSALQAHKTTIIDEDVTLRDNSSFFWFYAFDIAERHDIPLQNLLLVDKKRYLWTYRVSDIRSGVQEACNPHCSDILYFHQLPLTADGDVPTPFGYWSLDGGLVRTPQPELSLTEFELAARTESSYSYLSRFQADLVACFAQKRRLRQGLATCD